MRLRWDITDLDQDVIVSSEELSERLPESKVTIPMPQHNGTTTAQLRLHTDDPACASVAEYETLLRTFLVSDDDSSSAVFIGRITTPSTENETLTVNALGPWHHLENSVLSVENQLEVVLAAGSTSDSAQLISQLISDYASDAGIVDGTLPDSLNTGEGHGSGETIASEVLKLLNNDGGPDMELLPNTAGGGTIATLNVFASRQGSDLSASVGFEYGQGEETATGFKHEPAVLCNKCIALGNGGAGGESFLHYAVQAQHNASIAQYGEWARIVTVDTLSTGYLGYVAAGIVVANAYPVQWFDITSAPLAVADESGPPVFGPDHDFWLGDTIGVQAHTASRDFSLDGRVLQGGYIELASGQVSVELECVPEDFSAGVTTTDLSPEYMLEGG